MSADFHLIQDDMPYDDAVELDFNLTYNLSKMFGEVADSSSIGGWMKAREGKLASEIHPDADAILLRLVRRPELCVLNPENGWGSYDSFVSTWISFTRALALNPSMRLSICI